MNIAKKTLILSAILCLPLCAIFAQFSELYSSSEAGFARGVELYMQGKWGASERELKNYHGKSNQAQTQFYLAANAFEMRRKDARKQLQAYLKQNTYTPYSSEVHFMLGVILVEQNKYKQALKEFENVQIAELFRSHQAEFLFHRGYAHLKMNEPQKALSSFGKLKTIQSRYSIQAKYYYAFCQYSVQNYGRALPDFLEIENTEAYKDIVPYYIIQIYYAEGQLDQVQERAEALLANNPDNPNNAELHRMIGEIYYQQKQYRSAIDQLLIYIDQTEKIQKEPTRSDMYLLGMSYYNLKEWQNSIDYLLKVKKADDEMTQNTCFHLGNAYIETHDNEAAKISYAAAMRYNFNKKIKEEAMYNYALTTYKSSSALGESVTAFSDFLKEYPDSDKKEKIYELLCDALTQSKNYSAALQMLDSIALPTKKMEETKQYLRFQLGADAYMQGKNEQALQWFGEVIKYGKSQQNNTKQMQIYLADSYFFRAESYYKQHDYKSAEKDIKQMLSLQYAKFSANYPMVDYSLGYALFSQKKYAEALECFLRYTDSTNKQLATWSDAQNRAGDCYFNARRFLEAESCYTKVAAIGGVGADYATFQKGYALGLLKRYADKISVLEGLVQKYPKSDYADDALYEIARAQLQQNNNTAAISTYERLLSQYHNSNNARKAALEKAMIYYNEKQYAQAIEGYKAVIKQYPGSEEAYSALDGLEMAYIETDNVAEYLAYTKSLGKINMKTDTKEDSLTYIAAERQYILQNYTQAITGFTKYISQYCNGGRYCTTAHYYLADSYYKTQDKDAAMQEFAILAEINGNPYMEEALTKVAEISYDEQDYKTAINYFRRLQIVADKTEKKAAARLGILRCSYMLNDNTSTINIASEIISDSKSTPEVLQEARFHRAKSYIALNEPLLAIEDLNITSTEVRTSVGAESRYLLAQLLFEQKQFDKSEATIMEFAQMNTQQQYWLARSFIVLADIYAVRGDLFQAKQYLLSLQQNYRIEDDVQILVKQKLDDITKIEQSSDHEEDNDE